MIEIKHKITGEVLKTIEAENLIKADLSRANLSRANLLFCKMDKRVFEQITEEWFE